VNRFYLTTAIDYVNSRPHLGTAYEKITADVIARYKRLSGFDTRFCMGNDEHSQNVFKQAADEGVDPLAYCDRMERVFRDTWARLDISFDDFIRTTEPRHRAGVTEIVRRLHEAGDIYDGLYEGWYCVGCEAFKPEKDLVDGRCPLHPKTAPQWLTEKNYFFRLSRYEKRLAEHIERHPGFIAPEVRRNEIVRLIQSGLEDISVSRAGQAWGIPLPFDASSVVYVWFDALINYASAVGLGDDQALFETWWPADLHIIGKDITRFHAVIWPAMLMAAGLPLPRAVFGHGFMTVEGQRMSKSLGNVVDPIDAVDRLRVVHGLAPELSNRIGPDPLRLYLTKEVPYGGDGDFSWDRYDERYNVDLSNNLGNLVSRVATMVHRYCGGTVRPTGAAAGRLAALGNALARSYRNAMDDLALHEGAAAAFRLVDATNEYIAETAPWSLAKDPASHERVSQVLYDAAEAIRLAAVLLLPIMPRSSAEILRRVGGEAAGLTLERDGVWRNEGERAVVAGDALWPRVVSATFSAAGSGTLTARGASGAAGPRSAERAAAGATATAAGPGAATKGAATAPVTSGARRTVRQEGDTRVSENANESAAPAADATRSADGAAAAARPRAETAPATTADRIAIDDFMKVELRVARVIGAERVPKSSKLLKLVVDAGAEPRTMVAGIAESYEPDALVGRSVVIVANLKPAKLMGVESNGMVLAASPEGGRALLVTFDEPPAPGTRVR
jgi:methionyl-tRNA synthetase